MQTPYTTDVLAWAHEQAALMRSGQLAALDIEHLAEELETMGASQRRELKNRLAVLLQHLLKWSFQPDHRSRSWEATLLEQRTAIEDALTDSPSLRSALQECFAKAYPRVGHPGREAVAPGQQQHGGGPDDPLRAGARRRSPGCQGRASASGQSRCRAHPPSGGRKSCAVPPGRRSGAGLCGSRQRNCDRHAPQTDVETMRRRSICTSEQPAIP